MAQPKVSVSSRVDYVMKTYKISKQRAEAYESIRDRLLVENEKLKKQKMTSKEFQSAQKRLYKKYGDEISMAFYDGKYRKWSSCTQHLECYHMLSENWLVPYEKMRSLRKIEVEHEKKREQIWAGSKDEAEKNKLNEELRGETENAVRNLLGAAGEWYIEYKRLYLATLKNMDVYKSSFQDAHAVAAIENEFRCKRKNVLKEQKSNMEKEFDFMKLEDEKHASIVSAVPSDMSARWKKINSALLDYNLNSKYGLTQSQVVLFKKAYSKYVIEEYKILNAKKIAKADKYAQLSTLSKKFCNSVAVLFQAEQYKKWQGWWQYSFDRKMEMKGLK